MSTENIEKGYRENIFVFIITIILGALTTAIFIAFFATLSTPMTGKSIKNTSLLPKLCL